MSTDVGTPSLSIPATVAFYETRIIRLMENEARLERELAALRAVHEAVQAALKEMLISHENLYRSRFGERSNPNDDIVRQQALRTISRPYKLIGCVQHDCEACIARENQYKERCEELTALRAAHEAAQAELAAYDAIINDDGSLTTHADKLTILQDMAHAYKHSSDWEAQEEKLRVAQAEIAVLRELLVHANDLLDDAQSGYISGCGEDLKWNKRHEDFREEFDAARKGKA